MPTYFVYPIYTGILALILFILVPRESIRELVFHGVVFGGIGDFLAILFYSHFLGVLDYINYGPFGLKGMPFFPILAWTIWFIMFFYFMPDNKTFRNIYMVTAAAYSTFFSNILVNLNIFKWNYSNIVLPFLIYISWFSISVWIKKELIE
ncbi:hypothetical protein MWH25_11775 [Natroniella acetigena]|uniref:hypothetical protein n=1 Tax=Natroniella acetigena TaxID=52004 RepID=UPI00200A80D6|nr:hypothetical protein [Natroniella acetigena]MCK8828405.1 hypothetical protein [Natroniella acetigena]